MELGAGALGHLLLDLTPDGHLQDLEIEPHVRGHMLHTPGGRPLSHQRSTSAPSYVFQLVLGDDLGLLRGNGPGFRNKGIKR